MLLYRDGEPGAFDVLYARHKGGVYRYLLRQCREAAAAEELFQDVWMNLVRARAGYTVQAKFTTYLYRLAHNRLIDHYRTIPETLRAESRDGDASPDTRLVDALGIAETQIGRMTEQLASGAFDELATQHRFLELKYEGDGPLSSDGRHPG